MAKNALQYERGAKRVSEVLDVPSEQPTWTSRYQLVQTVEVKRPKIGVAAVEEHGSESNLGLRAEDARNLHPWVTHVLKTQMGIQQLFPIQKAVCAHLLRTAQSSYLGLGEDELSPYCTDVGVTAPTGQGKTLSYVIPIVSGLCCAVVPRVRALVVVPTRELAQQVAEVFQKFSCTQEGYTGPEVRSLKVVCMTGKSSLVRELQLLHGQQAVEEKPTVRSDTDVAGQNHMKNRVVFRPEAAFVRSKHLDAAMDTTWSLAQVHSYRDQLMGVTQAPPDVVVCTPGRFVDHFNFDEDRLQRGEGGGLWDALRWVVIDEADRLLGASYMSWIECLAKLSERREREFASKRKRADSFTSESCVPIWEDQGEIELWSPRRHCWSQIQKLLFSATLTKSPQKLAKLRLVRPMFFLSSTSGTYTTPTQMSQRYVKCRDELKPLTVLFLLYQLHAEAQQRARTKGGYGANLKVVVFCAARAVAHKLARLLQIHFATERGGSDTLIKECGFPTKIVPASESLLPPPYGKANGSLHGSVFTKDQQDEVTQFWEAKALPTSDEQDSQKGDSQLKMPIRLKVREFSASFAQSKRDILMEKFRNGSINVLVASDVAARGLDIVDVDVVINYDVPVSARLYIHRAGRTARAGREGVTYTIVHRNQVAHFKEMLKTKSSGSWLSLVQHYIPFALEGDVGMNFLHRR
eukprot:GHVN01089280.1.p1 GENE.GHVN01089280.1~~GHVN01089280.1.p1  ORF type:complete len:691 (+),score=53.93 GHVN01089280.1:1890-3962(+)